MSKREKSSGSKDFPDRPGISIEDHEQLIIALAMNEAEKRIRNGTASNQLLTHFVKLGSTKDIIEKEMMVEKKKLIEAKTKEIEEDKKTEEMYTKAIQSMREYAGLVDDSDEEEADEDY